MNEFNGLPGIPYDVSLVREWLNKLQRDNGEPLRYLLRVNL